MADMDRHRYCPGFQRERKERNIQSTNFLSAPRPADSQCSSVQNMVEISIVRLCGLKFVCGTKAGVSRDRENFQSVGGGCFVMLPGGVKIRRTHLVRSLR